MSDEETPVKKASADESSCSSAHATDKLALVFASILCRLWLGVRALQTGIEKYAGEAVTGNTAAVIDGKENEYGLTAGSTVEKIYSFKSYTPIDPKQMADFQDQPLMLGFFLKIFAACLGPALIVLGLTVILGVGTRISLMAQGLLYIALTWGLLLIGGAQGSAGAAQLAAHMILIVLALGLIKHDRFVILKKW